MPFAYFAYIDIGNATCRPHLRSQNLALAMTRQDTLKWVQVMTEMRFQKLRRSIEKMPRPAYIFLRALLALAALMLLISALLFALGGDRLSTYHLAVQLLETPAGVLLLGVIGLALLLDHSG